MSKEKQIEEMAQHEYKCQSCFHAGVCPEKNPETYRCVHHVDKADVAPRPEWISVEERLPEKVGRYLVYGVIGGHPLVCGAHYDKHNGFGDNDLTHWMPLPEPPKGDRHE